MKLKIPALMLVGLLLTALTSCQKAELPPAVKVTPVSGHDYIFVGLNNAVQVIDCETDTVVKTIPFNDYIIQGAFSPDGKRYYANAFRCVYVFDTVKQELVDTYPFSTELSKVTVAGVAPSEDLKTLYIACTVVKKKQNVPKLNLLPPQLVVFDLETKKILRNYEIPLMVSTVLTLRNDPEHLILIGYDVFKFSLKTGKAELMETLFNPKKGDKVRNCLPAMTPISPGDHGIVAYPYYAGEGLDVSSGYLMIDRNQGTTRLLGGNNLWMGYSAMLAPDGKYLYSIMDELVKIDAQTGKTVAFVRTETGTCYGVTTSSDGRKIYVGPAGPDLSVYDAETLKLLKVIPLEADGGYAMQRVTL